MSDDNITYIEDHRTLEERFEENKFKTLDEFKWSIKCGGEIEIEYKEGYYFIGKNIQEESIQYYIFEILDDKTIRDVNYYQSIDKLLDHELSGKKLREIYSDLLVWGRFI